MWTAGRASSALTGRAPAWIGQACVGRRVSGRRGRWPDGRGYRRWAGGRGDSSQDHTLRVKTMCLESKPCASSQDHVPRVKTMRLESVVTAYYCAGSYAWSQWWLHTAVPNHALVSIVSLNFDISPRGCLALEDCRCQGGSLLLVLGFQHTCAQETA